MSLAKKFPLRRGEVSRPSYNFGVHLLLQIKSGSDQTPETNRSHHIWRPGWLVEIPTWKMWQFPGGFWFKDHIPLLSWKCVSGCSFHVVYLFGVVPFPEGAGICPSTLGSKHLVNLGWRTPNIQKQHFLGFASLMIGNRSNTYSPKMVMFHGDLLWQNL